MVSDRLKVLSHIIGAKFQRPKTPAALADLQSKKLRAAIDYATATFPFYHRFRGEDFSSLPVIDKSIYLAHFHELNILGLSHEEAQRAAAENELGATRDRVGIQLGLSTGTSGSRGVFMTSAEERARWAGTILERCLPSLWARLKIAFFLRADNQLYQTAENGGRLQLRFFDLRRPLTDAAADLNSYKPDLLIAPPYVLAGLARLRTLTIEPATIISAADVLDTWDARTIRQRFQVPIHQIYQATEGFLGATCALGHLHLNEDLLLFEKKFLDREQLRFIPVISDFHRRTQGVLRFELDDVLRLSSEPCPCGSPLQRIDGVDGRRDEIFYCGEKPVFRGELARALQDLENPPGDFRLVQTGRSEFELWLPENTSQNWRNELSALFLTRLRELEFERCRLHIREDLHLSLHEKRRRFIRLISQSNSLQPGDAPISSGSIQDFHLSV